MDYDDICQSILNIDPKIRFAGICNENAKLKHGGQRPGLPNLLNQEDTKRSLLQAIANWSFRNSLSSKVGEGKYAMTEYEKIKRITIPIEDNQFLMVSAEVDTDHTRVIEKILEIIKDKR